MLDVFGGGRVLLALVKVSVRVEREAGSDALFDSSGLRYRSTEPTRVPPRLDSPTACRLS